MQGMAAAGEGGGEGRNRSAQVSKLSQRRVKGSGASMPGVDLFSPQLTYVDAPFPDLYFHPDLSFFLFYSFISTGGAQ